MWREWPTLLVLAATYLVWGLGTTVAAQGGWLPLGIVLVALAIAQHSSLSHEMLHGHPSKSERLNAALVFPALILVIPYLRFRDTHLSHHQDNCLTDPYDDPESNYMDPAVWDRLSGPVRALLRANNTLAGRLTLGPLIGTALFVAADIQDILRGDRRVLAGWLLHLPALALVVWWLAAVAAMPVWAYLLAVWIALGILKIRTFLEHRAHELVRGRTVVIEDRGPLALIFLNNNLHAVHHQHPGVAWFRLWDLYRSDPDRYLRMNEGYRYPSYADVFRRHFLRAKDPVPHPLWRRP